MSPVMVRQKKHRQRAKWSDASSRLNAFSVSLEYSGLDRGSGYILPRNRKAPDREISWVIIRGDHMDRLMTDRLR
jgi:hypothetical protein